LAKVTDGKSKTFGKSKKQTSPWFSAKAAKRFLPCRRAPFSWPLQFTVATP